MHDAALRYAHNNPREHRARRADRPERIDHARLAPSAKLEVMMNRAHAENALAARLKRNDLQDHRQCLTEEDNTHDGQQQLRMREDRNARERATECK